ncbi:MAG: pyruvyl transferase [Paraglaciecola sp.]|jgi:pyruvyltransferase
MMLKNIFRRMGTSSTNSAHTLKYLSDKYTVDYENLHMDDGGVRLTYWVLNPNFGDVLSSWLFKKLTGKATKLVNVATNSSKSTLKKPTYISVGSILSRVQDVSEVWGTGSFGTEQATQISKNAKYHAVRGPLTRCLVNNVGGSCPAVYGDPALLAPLVYNPDVEIKHEVGVVLRWSEKSWLKVKPGKGVKLIDLGTSDVEGVIDQIKSCKKIITSSLHGLIIADTYGIPNAWLSSSTPKGGEFKFYDYFLSVDKIRHANSYDIDKKGLGLNTLLSEFDFDDRYINFAPNKLLDACPFLKRK